MVRSRPGWCACFRARSNRGTEPGGLGAGAAGCLLEELPAELGNCVSLVVLKCAGLDKLKAQCAEDPFGGPPDRTQNIECLGDGVVVCW